ncbi:MAG: aldolase [Nanobdellota archaeon]
MTPGDKMIVPLDVPEDMKKEYTDNYNELTHYTGRLMLFADDQRIEHLNSDFHGEHISEDDEDPEHPFRVAGKAKIGAMAAQLGLISRYGMDHKEVPYLVKLNSKTNLINKNIRDPFSSTLVDVEQVYEFKKRTGLNILGVGYTLYLGSEYEPAMLREASQMILSAHRHGLVTVLWIYPRGKAVKAEKDPDIIAGATGVAGCLGSDFVKVNYPEKKGKKSKDVFGQAVKAAGRTGVICAGGSSTSPARFLERLKEQMDAGASGNATGRNIHQKSDEEAVRFCNAIYAITVEGKTVEEAYAIYKG